MKQTAKKSFYNYGSATAWDYVNASRQASLCKVFISWCTFSRWPLFFLSFWANAWLVIGISRLLKACMRSMLNDQSRNTCALKSRSGSCKTFKSVREVILSSLNRFLYESHKSLIGCDIWLDFRDSHQTNYFKWFFSDASLTKFLEGSDYNVMDFSSSSLGALVEEFWGLYETAKVTKVFTQYVDTLISISKSSYPRLVEWQNFQTVERYHLLQDIHKPDIQYISTIWYRRTEVTCSRPHLWCDKENGWFDVFACRSFWEQALTV